MRREQESPQAAPQLTEWRDLPRIELYMDQLIAILQAELSGLWLEAGAGKISPSMVNNYVKVKLVPPPLKKRYERQHICALLIVFILKSVLSMQELALLLPKLLLEFKNDWAALHLAFVTHLQQAMANPGAEFKKMPPCYEQVLIHAVMAYAERFRAARLLNQLQA